MVEFRTFKNNDPPHLARLWETCGLGRGAAAGVSPDVLDLTVFSQLYFDPQGVILAWEGAEPVGFVHAGFCTNAEETGLSHEKGVICMIMVRPDHRRKGIGRGLLEQAERYLLAQGAKTITAGPSDKCDPFYVGLYGGSRPAGVLESDRAAGPFLLACGYEAGDRRLVFERDLTTSRDPIHFRLANIRRQTQLAIVDGPERRSWWWLTRYGRLESLRFALIPKAGGSPLAIVTAVGLDFFAAKWNQRPAGLIDLYVPQQHRRKGYGQTILLEVIKKLKEETITLVNAQASEANVAATGVLKSAGLVPVDSGVSYRKIEE